MGRLRIPQAYFDVGKLMTKLWWTNMALYDHKDDTLRSLGAECLKASKVLEEALKSLVKKKVTDNVRGDQHVV